MATYVSIGIASFSATGIFSYHLEIISDHLFSIYDAGKARGGIFGFTCDEKPTDKIENRLKQNILSITAALGEPGLSGLKKKSKKGPKPSTKIVTKESKLLNFLNKTNSIPVITQIISKRKQIVTVLTSPEKLCDRNILYEKYH